MRLIYVHQNFKKIYNALNPFLHVIKYNIWALFLKVI